MCCPHRWNKSLLHAPEMRPSTCSKNIFMCFETGKQRRQTDQGLKIVVMEKNAWPLKEYKAICVSFIWRRVQSWSKSPHYPCSSCLFVCFPEWFRYVLTRLLSEGTKPLHSLCAPNVLWSLTGLQRFDLLPVIFGSFEPPVVGSGSGSLTKCGLQKKPSWASYHVGVKTSAAAVFWSALVVPNCRCSYSLMPFIMGLVF